LPRLSGAFKGDRVQLEFQNRGGQTNGTLQFKGQTYPFTAAEVAGDVEGEFKDGTNSLPFTLANQKRILFFQTGAFGEPLIVPVPKLRAYTAKHKQGLFAIVDGTPQLIEEPNFDHIAGIVDGVAAAVIGNEYHDKYVKYVFIDFTGETLSETQCEGFGWFSEQLAPVKIRGKWGFIDTSGCFAIQPQFVYAFSFHDGRAPVRLTEESDGRHGFTYIDKNGRSVFSALSSGIWFQNGLLAVTTADHQYYGCVDTNGTQIERFLPPKRSSADLGGICIRFAGRMLD
jgi:hypothetical protein